MHYRPEPQNISQLVEMKLASILLLFQKGALYYIISNNNNNNNKKSLTKKFIFSSCYTK